jgi:hypothetical protein
MDSVVRVVEVEEDLGGEIIGVAQVRRWVWEQRVYDGRRYRERRGERRVNDEGWINDDWNKKKNNYWNMMGEGRGGWRLEGKRVEGWLMVDG